MLSGRCGRSNNNYLPNLDQSYQTTGLFIILKNLRHSRSVCLRRNGVSHYLHFYKGEGGENWPRITKYICSLRSKSTKCSRIIRILYTLSLFIFVTSKNNWQGLAKVSQTFSPSSLVAKPHRSAFQFSPASDAGHLLISINNKSPKMGPLLIIYGQDRENDEPIKRLPHSVLGVLPKLAEYTKCPCVCLV